jgi:hypothetical protein
MSSVPSLDSGPKALAEVNSRTRCTEDAHFTFFDFDLSRLPPNQLTEIMRGAFGRGLPEAKLQPI